MNYLDLIMNSIGFGVVLIAFPIILIASLAGLFSDFVYPFYKDNPTIWKKKDAIMAYTATITADSIFTVLTVKQFISLKQSIDARPDFSIGIAIVTVIITLVVVILLYYAYLSISEWIRNRFTVVKNGVLKKAGSKDIDAKGSFIFPESVTEFNTYAFYYNAKKFRKIIIPNTVKEIEEFQFKSCTNLEKVFIPDSVIEIDSDYFTGPSSLKEIVVDENNPNYMSEDGVLYNKEKTELFLYPGGKTDETYVIPKGVQKVKGVAFLHCDNLKEIHIPSSLNEIGNGSFPESTNLNAITVDKNNPNYCDIDGILFSKDKTIIRRYPTGRNEDTYTVPETVKEIDFWAFHNCKYLKKIILPNHMKNDENIKFAQIYDFEIIFSD